MTFIDRVSQERWEGERLSPWAMKSAASRGRRYTELEHPLRTCFQRDRDRVIHTSSFRRLEYKTQVFVNHEGDNYRTRLTHSLEGAQIGRTAARVLALNEELVEALVLGHDLGHTPFGHAGERVMAELMKDQGGFEHNRQTLRVLETLERRSPDYPGLNLTWEVREGIIKHQADSDPKAPEEYARGEAPTLEAQLVDFVDEIAYNNHDIDDGLNSAMFTIEQIRSVPIFRSAHESVLREGPGEDSVLRRQIVSKIIDRCLNDLVMTTLQRIQASRVRSLEDVRHAGGRLVSYSGEMAESVSELKAFLFTNMYRNWRVMRMADKAGRILRDLFGSYVSEPLQLPPQYQARFEADGKYRVICDYIAGMTDRFAVDEHRRLFDPLVRV